MKPAGDDSSARLKALLGRTADALRAAGGDRWLIAAAFERLIDEGMEVVHSPSAMWDYAGGVMRRAGFDRQQTDRGYRIFSTVTRDRFMGERPYPDDWPWHEVDPLTGESLI